jgi:hypothetical protein
LKPIQKLQNEASTHFGKIQRYAPEIFHPHEAGQSIPWDSVKPLARTIQSLKRSDLLAAWDRMMDPKNRSRIVSCVYGKTFPLTTATIPTDVTTKRLGGLWESVRVVDSFQNLMKIRNRLGVFDDSASHKRGMAPRFLSPLASAFDASLSRNRTVAMVSIGVLGFGVIGLTLAGRSKKLGTRR